MSGDGLEHEGLERLFGAAICRRDKELDKLFGRDVANAAKSVAWVCDTLKTLVDNPRLLDNKTFLLGTLRALVGSIDADNNPKMAALKIPKGEARRV